MLGIRRWSIAFVAVSLAACSGGPTATPPPASPAPNPPAATATPTQAPTVPLSPSPLPTESPSGTTAGATPLATATTSVPPAIQLVGDAPALEASALGDGHYVYILPASYFVVDDSLHAYFVGFAEEPGDQRVFHAVSGDGVEWTVDDADPFVNLGIETAPPGPIPTSVMQTADGYVMYMWVTEPGSARTSEIWRATSSKPEGPWVADAQPALTVGERGAWDDLGLDFPSVVATADGYAMLYSANGGTSPHGARIGLATSSDGITWMRQDEPVIDAGVCPYDQNYVAAPRLTAIDDGYLVLYNTERAIGAAMSGDDLGAWQCASDAPLLSGTDVPNGQGIHTFATTSVGSRLSVLIESLIDGASEIWLGDIEDPSSL